MRRFPTKIVFGSAVGIAGVILIISVVLNILLVISKGRFVDTARSYVTEDLRIGYAAYVFPNILVVRNVTFSEKELSLERRRLTIPTVVIKFSAWAFLSKREIAVSRVDFLAPAVNHSYFCDFLKKNGEQLMTLLMALPRIDFKFTIKDALFDFSKESARPEYVHANLDLKLKGNTLFMKGTLRRDKYAPADQSHPRPRRTAKGTAFEYDFKGILMEDGLLIDNLALRRKNMYLKLWGWFKNHQLQLNGFSFIDTFAKEEYHPINLKVLERVRSSFKKTKTASPGVKIDESDVYMIDIDLLAELSFKEARIQYFKFNLNDMPVAIRGSILFSEPLTADLAFLFYPAQSKTLRLTNVKEAGLTIKGTMQDTVFTAASRMHIDFDRSVNPNFPMARVEGELNHLKFFFDEYARSIMDLGHGTGNIWIDENAHKIEVENLRVSLRMFENRLKLFEVAAPFYGGRLKGKVWVRPESIRNHINAIFTLRGIDAGRLNDLLVHFAKAEGRLDGDVRLNTAPALQLSGALSVRDGRLKEFQFFEWLSRTFRLPSLRVVDFSKLSSKFHAGMRELKFYDIQLLSGNVGIRGYFNVDKDTLVASDLSLMFSKELLSESPDFRPILRIFGEDTPVVIFDFQLSGRQDAMNFQWLPSEHKQRIQERIPDFIERTIERNIEEMIEPSKEE